MNIDESPAEYASSAISGVKIGMDRNVSERTGMDRNGQEWIAKKSKEEE